MKRWPTSRSAVPSTFKKTSSSSHQSRPKTFSRSPRPTIVDYDLPRRHRRRGRGWTRGRGTDHTRARRVVTPSRYARTYDDIIAPEYYYFPLRVVFSRRRSLRRRARLSTSHAPGVALRAQRRRPRPRAPPMPSSSPAVPQRRGGDKSVAQEMAFAAPHAARARRASASRRTRRTASFLVRSGQHTASTPAPHRAPAEGVVPSDVSLPRASGDSRR